MTFVLIETNEANSPIYSHLTLNEGEAFLDIMTSSTSFTMDPRENDVREHHVVTELPSNNILALDGTLGRPKAVGLTRVFHEGDSAYLRGSVAGRTVWVADVSLFHLAEAAADPGILQSLIDIGIIDSETSNQVTFDEWQCPQR